MVAPHRGGGAVNPYLSLVADGQTPARSSCGPTVVGYRRQLSSLATQAPSPIVSNDFAITGALYPATPT